jgi:hypothetical protein
MVKKSRQTRMLNEELRKIDDIMNNNPSESEIRRLVARQDELETQLLQSEKKDIEMRKMKRDERKHGKYTC